VIADLSVNFVERQVYLCGFSVDRIASDYGLDLILWTYTEEGEVENGAVLIQVKATDRLTRAAGGREIVCRVSQKDLRYWAGQWMPVILVLYDAGADLAYWLYVQAY
jgi:hypothetical protein